ncbi:MAG: PQQ-binding-like beta-propeller repeat protein [Chthoniobacter sp.]|uniref:outer membrane protein assembly factor BamB family protein n=1 Tax=Chthoniobacter sp. TaxID=2510640 RepID=UPI0032A5F601
MKNPLALLCAVCCLASTAIVHAEPAAEAQAILEKSGVQGGLVVHLGIGDGALTAALHANDSYTVQGLDTDAARVAKVRETLFAKGGYGPVSVDRFDGKALPYIDNFVNLLVAENTGGISMEEIQRVLVPNGVALIKQGNEWQKTVKPKSGVFDEWTHYYYDAKGNAVSKDKQVGPPTRLQWVGSPRWSRHHDRMSSLSAEVSAGGRIYYIMDEGSRVSILLPSHWSLMARDAFNGMILWKKPIENWSDHMWPLKSGPTQLTRRLVADGDHIFVTLGIGEPIARVDGATGKVIRTYPDTKGAEEILHVDGVLYSLVNPGDWALKDYAPKLQSDQKRVQDEYEWDKKPRMLVAVDANTGQLLWKKENTLIAPITLASDGRHVVYYNGDQLICLDAKSGEQRWASESEPKRSLLEYNFGPRVLITGETILYAGGDGSEKGIDATSGKELWKAPHQKSGYRSPEDLIVAGGLVWNAPTTNSNSSGEFIGRDPRTGAEKKQFSPDVPDGTYWFHHRCYIAKATEDYIIPSRTGIEYVDINKEHWNLDHWVRGACLYGVLPANGLTYAGPHNCACYPEAKLDGLNALSAATSPYPAVPPDEQRLEHGPAWGQPLDDKKSGALDWPTYRHDTERSGYADQPLANDLSKAWSADLGGKLSAMTVADGKAFVSQIDAHTLHALDANTGQPLWHFIAGARVDSPPTIWQGRVLFGCMDGWVYCLRESDGALIWRFQAAPNARQHGAFEQVESVWPVHGSVLEEKGVISLVAGRSCFLDGGLRFLRLDAATGKKQVEQVYDDKDPDAPDHSLQERHKTLQMPVALNDILSSDGKVMYLRSQKIGDDGVRIDIGPVSGNPVLQGSAQKGEGRHLFAPMGFLDDTWFHRSYWVFGKSFAGGHSGYFQAGKYTPEGRILVHDDKNVFGYSRLPQYYKWTTTMEHQLFSASKDAPDVVVNANEGGGGGAKKKQAAAAAAKAAAVHPSVKFDATKIDPSNTPLTVEAWILPDGPDGVIAQHGGGATGYALALQEGRPGFSVRAEKTLATAESARALDQGWHHIAGVLTADKKLLLFVDGQLAAETKATGFIARRPNQGLVLGDAPGSKVSDFGNGAPYTGLLDQFAVWPKALGEGDMLEHANGGNYIKRGNGALIACSFDTGTAGDDAGGVLIGAMSGIDIGKGKSGKALWFHKAGNAAPVVAGENAKGGDQEQAAAKLPAGSFVQHQWNTHSPVFARAMAMAKGTVFVSGPPDMIDEEYAFQRMSQKDPAIYKDLEEQDAALDGKSGGTLLAVKTDKGEIAGDVKLDSPPVWDGMAIAQGRLYVASVDGKVTCYGRK